MPKQVNSLIYRTALAAFLSFSFFSVASAQDRIEGSTADGATFSLPSIWEIGAPLEVSGTNWTTIDGNRGSVIGVKYDFGDVVPHSPVDELDDIWLRIVASRDGSFAVELPFPEGFDWSAGETHTVHLLTGALGNNDKVRNPTLRLTLVDPD